MYSVALGCHHSCNESLHCKPEKIFEVYIHKNLRADVLKSLWYSPIWLYRDVPLERVCFFDLAVLNREYNFPCLCPKQGQNLSYTE